MDFVLRRAKKQQNGSEVRQEIPLSGKTVRTLYFRKCSVEHHLPKGLRLIRNNTRQYHWHKHNRGGNNSQLCFPAISPQPTPVKLQQQQRYGEKAHHEQPNKTEHLGDDVQVQRRTGVKQNAKDEEGQNGDIWRTRARYDFEEKRGQDAVECKFSQELAGGEDTR